VGIALVAVGLIVLTGRQASNPNAIPYADVPRISAAEAHNQQQTGSGVIYDVREMPFYQESHAAGALPLPEDEALAHLEELPSDKSLIFY
jgi:rhodanese-related sulfurtransferase